MKGVQLPDSLPEVFIDLHQSELGENPTLSDPPQKTHPVIAGRAQALAKAVVERIKESIFPIIGV
jgi:hypothetical protein